MVKTFESRRSRGAFPRLAHRGFQATLWVGTWTLAACITHAGGGGASSDIQSICSKFVSCGTPDTNGVPYTQSSCQSDFAAWIPPEGCASAADETSCAAINGKQSGAYDSSCFPSCSGEANVCSGNSLTICNQGKSLTLDCAKVCSQGNQSYTGVCGASYKGQTTSDGQQECWCGAGDTSVGGTGPSPVGTWSESLNGSFWDTATYAADNTVTYGGGPGGSGKGLWQQSGSTVSITGVSWNGGVSLAMSGDGTTMVGVNSSGQLEIDTRQ